MTKLFDGLVYQRSDGVLEPLAAESWQVLDDAKRFVFNLRRNSIWSDGNPVTARDFEYAIKRVLNPKTAAEYAASLYPIRGAKQFHSGAGPEQAVAVTATGDFVLTIETENPAVYLLAIASTWTMFPVRRDVVEGPNGEKLNWTKPETFVGNGPFVLKEWLSDRSITLEKNRRYAGSHPILDRVEYRIFADTSDQAVQILHAYEANELDALGVYSVPPSDVDRVRQHPQLKDEIRLFDRSGASYVCINNAKSPLSDPRVRMALGLSLERQKLLENVLRSPARPADTIFPRGIVGRNPSAWPAENADRAKQLLAEAGYPEGRGFPALLYQYVNSQTAKLTAEYFQGRWKEALGIELKLEGLELARFAPLRSGNRSHDLMQCSWASDFEDPANWFNGLFSRTVDPLQQSLNWSDDEAELLMSQAVQTADAATRRALYERADAIMARLYIAIPLSHNATMTLVRPYVENFGLRRIAGGTELRTVQIKR